VNRERRGRGRSKRLDEARGVVAAVEELERAESLVEAAEVRGARPPPSRRTKQNVPLSHAPCKPDTNCSPLPETHLLKGIRAISYS
jgi:hypothetical protein